VAIDASAIVATPMLFAARMKFAMKAPGWDEFYNDFDMRTSVDEASLLTVSYGEYVSGCDGLDVDALMARALRRAQWYFGLTEPNVVMTLSRQEWACLDTGKSAKPFLAHVTMYFDARVET